jgi:hypothetical protein
VTINLRPLSDVQARNVRWLVPGLIPLRTITLVAGEGGLGKSTWLAARAAEVSRGDLLGGQVGDVIIVSFEDAAEEVLRPRLEAAGGDLTRVHETVFGEASSVEAVRLPNDLQRLQSLVETVETRLLIIDPIVAAMDTRLDAHKDQHVRAVLGGLAQLAETAECAVVIVGHLNKAPSSEAFVRIANSIAFWNAARSVVLVTEDPEDPDELRLVAQRKANYSRRGSVERHQIDEIVLPTTLDPETGEPITTSRMVFLEYAPEVEADLLLAPKAGRGTLMKEGLEFLRDALADGSWHDSAGLKKLAAAKGISERTLKRASRQLEVEHERRGFPAVTHWRLRQSGQSLSNGGGPTDTDDADPDIPTVSGATRSSLGPDRSDGPSPQTNRSNGRFCAFCESFAECAERHSCRWIESLPTARS